MMKGSLLLPLLHSRSELNRMNAFYILTGMLDRQRHGCERDRERSELGGAVQKIPLSFFLLCRFSGV